MLVEMALGRIMGEHWQGTREVPAEGGLYVLYTNEDTGNTTVHFVWQE